MEKHPAKQSTTEFNTRDETMTRDTWLTIKDQIKITPVCWPTMFILFFDVFLLYISWKIFPNTVLEKFLSYFLATLAFLQVYLILHEATHTAISKISSINDMIGHICGFAVLMPYLPRQTSHLLHHTWTGHPVRDPANNRMIQKFSVITERDVKKIERLWKYWIPVIIINDRIGLWLSPHKNKKNGNQTAKNEKELFWNKQYLFGYTIFIVFLIISQNFALFTLWFLPSIISAFIIEELVNLPHHAETPLLSPTDKAVPYWEQQLVTHSCKSIPVWSKFIILSFNLHVAHHYYPNAPWSQLHNLDQKIKNDSQTSVDQLNEFSWSLKNRRKPLMSLMGHYFSKETI